ncbi:MAG TPA: alcohol dehydrogenase [Gammaproteobacteria bacterium]|nr:alcohol dehydrogenase [Gammaproteobacteria bacterium]
MKAVQVSKPGGPFEVVERDLPEPAYGQVRLKVEACGICHSDALVKDGTFPGVEYPRIPGHEVIGRIDALGDGVRSVAVDQRIGVGWHGGHCFQCEACRAGDFVNCSNAQIAGVSYDGGYAEYMLAPQEALASVPDTLSSTAAAPLLCAGITTFNALRNSGARAGDIMAILGIGGLGHLAVQFARKMGMYTVALSRGDSKQSLARELGAHEYIDTTADDPARRLQELGGARVILATAPSSAAISAVVGGLGRDGRLIVVGIDGAPVEVSPLQLIPGRRSVRGWPSGTPRDSEDTLNFSANFDVLPHIETYPLQQATEAYERMMSNQARFRVVLTMGD